VASIPLQPPKKEKKKHNFALAGVSEKLIGVVVKLQLTRCEKLVDEIGDILRKAEECERPSVGSRYQATVIGNSNRLRTLVCV
jgi:hypothetical protein